MLIVLVSCWVIVLLETSFSEASKNDPRGAEGDGKMRRNVGSQPLASGSRKKRADIIDPSLFDPNWVPDKYFGVRTATLITILNDKKYPLGQRRAYSMGVRLSSKLVLTLCSVVTYSVREDARVTPFVHSPIRTEVVKCLPKNIKVNVMDWVNRGQPTSVDAAEVLIHPKCDNQYDTDIAVIALATELAHSRDVWVHSIENLMFRRNLDRVVAAQGVLGRCSVPVFRNESNILTVDYVQVNYQQWLACKADVCPWWDEGPTRWQNPKRCNNLLNGTRYCLGWELSKPLCGLPPGTPVFCDVGHIHGLMGFIVNETLRCSPYDGSGVMSSMVDALDWVRGVCKLRYNTHYESSIPAWMSNLRANYTRHYVPRLKVKTTTTDGPIVRFDNFAGDQVRSMVVVYVEEKKKCIATMITKVMAILPCSCLTLNFKDMEDSLNIEYPDEYLRTVDNYMIKVGSFADPDSPKRKVKQFEIHPKCNNHYMLNFALITLARSIPGTKLAWIMTAHSETFGNLLQNVAAADQSMGYDCYWVDVSKLNNKKRLRHKVRFVHWTNCIPNMCPVEKWKEIQEGRCFDGTRNHSLYCLRSADPGTPICDLLDGTPIFCNVEAARGFVGFINGGMDLRAQLVPCRERAESDQTAVFTSIDLYLQYFKKYTFINEVEVFVRDRQIGQSSSSILAPSFFVVVTLLFMIIDH